MKRREELITFVGVVGFFFCSNQFQTRCFLYMICYNDPVVNQYEHYANEIAVQLPA